MKTEIINPEELRKELEELGLITRPYLFKIPGYSVSIKRKLLFWNWEFELADVLYKKKLGKWFYKGALTDEPKMIFKIINLLFKYNPQNTTEVNKNGSKESVNPEEPISEIVKEEEVNSLPSSNESDKKDTAL